MRPSASPWCGQTLRPAPAPVGPVSHGAGRKCLPLFSSLLSAALILLCSPASMMRSSFRLLLVFASFPLHFTSLLFSFLLMLAGSALVNDLDLKVSVARMCCLRSTFALAAAGHRQLERLQDLLWQQRFAKPPPLRDSSSLSRLRWGVWTMFAGGWGWWVLRRGGHELARRVDAQYAHHARPHEQCRARERRVAASASMCAQGALHAQVRFLNPLAGGTVTVTVTAL